MLYRIRNPNIRKLALVKNPASGHRWHLLKSAPDEGGLSDAELDAAIDVLSPEEAQALLEALPPTEEQRASEARQAIAKEFAGRLGQPIAKSEPESAAEVVAALARDAERDAIVQRQERVLADMRDRPKHATSWMQPEPTATAEETADMVMALQAADPRASKPQWGM